MDKQVVALLDKYSVTPRTRAFLEKEKRHYINGQFQGTIAPITPTGSFSV